MLRQTAYQVYANPTILSRLRNELNTLSPTSDWTPTQLMQLPYLTAVLKEGLRLSPGLGTRMARLSNKHINYQGSKSPKTWTIPPRTPVGMTTLFMHMDEEIFPEPEKFKPDRWLEGDENDRRRLERHFSPFSRGTRMCLGMQ
jgi:cytochrome P450